MKINKEKVLETLSSIGNVNREHIYKAICIAHENERISKHCYEIVEDLNLKFLRSTVLDKMEILNFDVVLNKIECVDFCFYQVIVLTKDIN